MQIKDHRSTKATDASVNSDEVKEPYLTSSIHNYEQWITPSPYAPYPRRKNAESDDKENQVSGAGADASSSKEKPSEPKTFPVVLFPTPQSLQEETFLQANSVDNKSGNRKAAASSIARTPSSATVPPTPLSAVPSTPVVMSHAAKRQKMSISGPEIQQFEAKITAATAAPMCLDLVQDIVESQALIDSLTDPLHHGKHPSPKTRKRTVAELAADERIAAQEQAFMLIMDEKANFAGKAANNDDDGTAPFEPSFEAFNAIQQIKKQHEERSQHALRHEAEQKRIELEKNNARRLQMERDNQQRARLEKEREHEKFRLAQQRQKELRAANIIKQQTLAAQTAAAQAAAAQQMANAQQIPMQNGYPPVNSSPVIRTGTPHSSNSPLIGNVGASGSAAMQATSSGQGSSPARPSSSAPHGHPSAGGIQMVHNRSRQQHPSRSGTPQTAGTPNMPNATPNIPHSTPNLQQGTPNSRGGQGSPNATFPAGPNGNMMNPQQVAAAAASMGVTPEHFSTMMQQRDRQHNFFNQQNSIVQANQLGTTAHQMQQGSISQASMQSAMQQQSMIQEQRRRAEAIRLQHQRQQAAMASLQNSQNAASPNPSMAPQQPNQPPQNRPMMPNGGGQPNPSNIGAMQNQLATRAYMQFANQMAANLGFQSPEQLNAQQRQTCKTKAIEYSISELQKQRLNQNRRVGPQGQNPSQLQSYSNGLGGMMRQQQLQQQQQQGGNSQPGQPSQQQGQQQQQQGQAAGMNMNLGGGAGGGGGGPAGQAGTNQMAHMQQMVASMTANGMSKEQIMQIIHQQQQQGRAMQHQPPQQLQQQQMNAQHAASLQSMQSMNNMGGMGMGMGNGNGNGGMG